MTYYNVNTVPIDGVSSVAMALYLTKKPLFAITLKMLSLARNHRVCMVQFSLARLRMMVLTTTKKSSFSSYVVICSEISRCCC